MHIPPMPDSETATYLLIVRFHPRMTDVPQITYYPSYAEAYRHAMYYSANVNTLSIELFKREASWELR